MKQQDNESSTHWYETCGEAFFTQLIIPFLHNPSQELKSLSLTCQYIYQIYSQGCDDYWKHLLQNKYCDWKKGILDMEKLKGKLMKLYFQLEYFENHLEKVPESLMFPNSIGMDSRFGVYRPCLISSSSYGCSYGQGFCTMLTKSVFSEGFDSSINNMDDFSYNLEMDDESINKRNVSLFPVVLAEEYIALFDRYIQRSDGIIFILVYGEFRPCDLKVELECLNGFYNRVSKVPDLMNRFIFNIAMYFKKNMSESEKNRHEEELRKYIKENYCFKNYLITKCNISNRDEVVKTTRETVKRYRFIDVNLFLKHLMKSEKKCVLM